MDKKEAKLKTYGLQVVIFLSFLALFSLIVAGIVFYGYQSNLDTMLQSSDELLYQISETITRQIASHLEPANKKGLIIKHLIENRIASFSAIKLNESFFLETLETYPQFQGLYYGDEDGNFFMTYRDISDEGDDIFTTKIVSRLDSNPNITYFHWDLSHELIASEITPIDYDPRNRPWYIAAKDSGKTIWTREYQLFTGSVPGITCAQPVFNDDDSVMGVVGVDFRLTEIDSFLKSLKIGESGIAFICDTSGNILAHPVEHGSHTPDYRRLKHSRPRAPEEQIFKTGPVREAIEDFKTNGRYKFVFMDKSDRYIASFRPLSEKLDRDWVLGIVVPEDDFIGPISRIHETTLLFSLWLLVIAGFLTSTLAREIANPIHKAIVEANRIQNLDFEGEVDLQSPISEIQHMGDTMNSMKKALSAFKKYVPVEIVKELVHSKSDAKLQAQAKKITVLFTDIRNFSSITEEADPNQLVEQLSEYFDCIARIIHKHNGTIDKYIGDSVMAFWGAPAENDKQAREACLAAIEIEEHIKILNEKWKKESREAFETRIGINTGVALIGNFGYTERFNYTAVGDNVNLASRLEGLNKVYGSEILVSESTEKEAGEGLIFRVLDMVAVKGRQQSVTVYQLLGTISNKASRKLVNLASDSEMALVHYLSSQWDEAFDAYSKILAEYPDDITAKMFVQRCKALRENPPDRNWDGVFRVKEK